jgi:hypothetical protein
MMLTPLAKLSEFHAILDDHRDFIIWIRWTSQGELLWWACGRRQMGKKKAKQDNDWEDDAEAIVQENLAADGAAAGSCVCASLAALTTSETLAEPKAAEPDDELVEQMAASENTTRRGSDTGGGFESVRCAYVRSADTPTTSPPDAQVLNRHPYVGGAGICGILRGARR